MQKFNSTFLSDLTARGIINQCTNFEKLDKKLLLAEQNNQPLIAYIGFDCTANSLHAGSLLQIMTLRRLQQHGHKPIILLGGGTSKIGDPSGKDSARQLLSEQQIADNMKGISGIFAKFLNIEDIFDKNSNSAYIVNNADWLNGLSYIDFLRDYGRHFSVARMLSFESVKLRLEREQNLSFLEFNYMIFQSYDFLKLYQNYGCILQIGGSDQWGNITAGCDLARRYFAETKSSTAKEQDESDNQDLLGLTTPLLTTSSGAKMGKTAGGAIWLNSELLSPYDYWQYWRNSDDADVGRFLRYFTDLELEEITKLEQLQDSQINQAKIILANEITALCHGKEEAQAAEKAAQALFSSSGNLDGNLAKYDLPLAKIADGITAFSLMRESGLCKTGAEAKRSIKQGGGKINDQEISDENYIIRQEDVIESGDGQGFKLSASKKRHIWINII